MRPIIIYYHAGIVEVGFVVQHNSTQPSDVAVTPANGVLVFEAGDSEKTITVSVVDDELPEEEEFLVVQLLSATGVFACMLLHVATAAS